MVRDFSSKETDKLAVKAGIWYVISEILIRGISFLTTPIFTRLLPTAVYGDVKIFDAWLYLLTPILSFAIYNSIERAKFDFKEKYDSYVSSVITLVIAFCLLILLALIPFRGVVSFLLGCSERILWIIPTYVAFYTSITCIQKRERQMMRYKSNIALSFLSVTLSVVTSACFIIFYRSKISDSALFELRIISFYLPIILLGVCTTGVAFARGKVLINKKYWKYGLSFSLPFVFYSISMQILNQSDKIMIKGFCGSKLAGIYAVATTVVYIMDVLNNAIQGAWLPWMFEKLNINEVETVKKIWKILLLGMGGLTWLIVMLGPELIAFLGGKKYSEAVWLLGPMVTGSLIHFITVGYTNIEKFYKKSRLAMYTSMVSIFVNLALNYYCIQKFGYAAAAYTTATSYFCAALIHHLFMKKYKIYDILSSKYTFLLIGSFVLINLCSMLLYNVPFYYRWMTIIIVFVVVVILCRNRIKQLINNYKVNRINKT